MRLGVTVASRRGHFSLSGNVRETFDGFLFCDIELALDCFNDMLSLMK